MSGEKSITIKDIAKKFNCSPSTVSRALNNHPSINEFTRKHIQEYAVQVGYQKNKSAVNFLKQKTNTIGVILPNITSYFNSAVISGIQKTLELSGYAINICLTNEIFDLEVNFAEKLIANNVDGIFISISSETQKLDHLEDIRKRNIPLVLFDRVCDFSTHKVQVNQYDGAKLAVKHLIKMGCKRIAHLGGPPNLWIAKQREKGYLAALKEDNLPILEELIRPAGFKVLKGVYPMQQLLNLAQPPDGVFAVNDNIAIAAMYAIRQKGLRIPEDIAVIGFDNEPTVAFINPSLSTIEQPTMDVGGRSCSNFSKSN